MIALDIQIIKNNYVLDDFDIIKALGYYDGMCWGDLLSDIPASEMEKTCGTVNTFLGVCGSYFRVNAFEVGEDDYTWTFEPFLEDDNTCVFVPPLEV